MAKQKGLLKLTGTLGDVNYYVLNGVGYARKAGGGFNSHAIKTKPSMQRVRENASEFGHCSTLKKHFRLALQAFLNNYKGERLHARMMSLLTSIKNMDTVSERGKRRVGVGILHPSAQRLLKDFKFTTSSKIVATLLSSSVFDWTTQALEVTNFDLKKISFPKNATHIGLKLGVLDFNFDTFDSKIALSSVYYLPKGNDVLSFNLEPENTISLTAKGIAVLGIQFYEETNGVYYPMDTMSVKEFKIITINI